MAVRLYTYEARDRTGNTATGSLQAASVEAAAQQLRDRGLIIIRLIAEEPAAPPGRAHRPGIGVKVRRDALAQFYREFATLIGAGMTIIQSLHTLDEHLANATLRWAVRGLIKSVEQGNRLSDSMKRYPEAFAPLAIALVAAGEHSGKLDDMLRVLAEYTERDLELHRMISRETFYPKLLVGAVLTIVPFGLCIARGFTSGAAAGVQMAANILLIYALALVLPYFILKYLVRAYGARQTGREAIDRLKLALPVLGAVLNRVAMSRFCRALAALYQGGVHLPDAVRLASDTLGNAAMTTALRSTVPHLESGGTLSEALVATRLTPNMVISMVRTGEQTGNMDELLYKVADYYDEETKVKIHQASVTIVPLSILIAAVIVLFIAISFFTSYFTQIFSAANG